MSALSEQLRGRINRVKNLSRMDQLGQVWPMVDHLVAVIESMEMRLDSLDGVVGDHAEALTDERGQDDARNDRGS